MLAANDNLKVIVHGSYYEIRAHDDAIFFINALEAKGYIDAYQDVMYERNHNAPAKDRYSEKS